jgi:hypothetical protein
MTTEVIDDGTDSAPGANERGRPLETIADIKRELRSVYWACRRQRMDQQRARTLTYILSAMHAMQRDVEMAARLETLEVVLDAGNQSLAPRAIGH